MIEVKVTAPTAPELAHLVISLASQFGVKLSTAQAEMVTEAEPTAQLELPTEEPKKAAKGKKEKAAPVEIQPETATDTQTELTKEDVAAACQKVSSTKNLDAAKAILAKFKSENGEACKRISDVQPSDRAKFIELCEAEVA